MNFLQQLQKTFPNFSLLTYIRQLEDSLQGCETILDVGCGDNSPLRLLSKKYSLTGVDGFKESLTVSKQKKIHRNYVRMDIRKLSQKFKKGSFDAVVALDVIEHLPKKDGEKLLRDMERIAKKVVILVTPNGFVPQYDAINNLQAHLSGWTVSDFTKKGYKVVGIYGLKQLRKDGAELRFPPKAFWGIISEVTHYFMTKYKPVYAFSLMVHKRVN